MSVIVETSKVILDYLKEIVPNAICRRSYNGVADITELKAAGKPIVFVVPIARTGELYREGGVVKNDMTFDIVVNAKLHNTDEPEKLVTEIDDLMEIVETIFAAFQKKSIKSDDNNIEVHVIDPEHDVLNDVEEIQDRNCFLSAVQVNCKVFISGTLTSP